MKITQAKSLFSGRVFKTVILLVITFLAGYFFNALLHPSPSGQEHLHPDEQAVEQESTMWTCSMHPQIRLPKPDKCPICFIDLIPIAA